MTAPLLEMRNIETYYGPIMAIRGVSLEVNEGEIVAVLGANGAGKTTLLKTATGALDSRKGRVLLDGREIQNRDPDWVARQGIAHVPEGREVFPFLTVDENLAMGAYNRQDKAAVREDIETVYGYFPVHWPRLHCTASFTPPRRAIAWPVSGLVCRDLRDYRAPES
jgi:branched-chain amino acid transport system ATP-binding protein